MTKQMSKQPFSSVVTNPNPPEPVHDGPPAASKPQSPTDKQVGEIEQSIAALNADKAKIVKAADDKAKAEAAEAYRIRFKQVNDLKDEYNAAEAEQMARLEVLFELIKEGKGMRVVHFTGDQWSNCWDSPGHFDVKLHIERMERSINEMVLGD